MEAKVTEPHEPQNCPPTEELVPVRGSGERLSIRDLAKVTLTVTADLGYCDLPVRDVLELKRGSVLPLSKLAGEMADVYVNGGPLAKAEIVVIGDALHVRIAEIHGMGEKEPSSE